MRDIFTYTSSDCVPVEQFYVEALAEREGHAAARDFAFDCASGSVGAWHVRRNLRAALRSELRNHRAVRIVSVEFEDFDSGRMHAGAHFAVVLEGPYEKLAEFAPAYFGADAEGFAEGIEKKRGA
jgi:hypothetical protein